MLLLNFRPGEGVKIGENMQVWVENGDGRIRLLFDAPKDVCILREALYQQANPGYRPETYQKSVMELAAMQARQGRKAAREAAVMARRAQRAERDAALAE